MKKVAIIGAGNISNTRHIPALRKIKDVVIFGIIGIRKENVIRTAKKNNVKNILIFKKGESYYEAMKDCEWFKEVDAVVIGAPPKDHFSLVEAALLNDKHVLVEKPMVMNKKEADYLISLARKRNLRFCVMHNFQYASGVIKLEKLIKNEELGEIISFFESQVTNRNRRLPEWYNDLPLGLFYDEAAHFIYLLEKFGGKIKVLNAYANFINKEETPLYMNVNMKAGKYPVNLFINFNSPICEWNFVVFGSKKIAIYDFFKDILIVLPTDNEHRAKDILRTSTKFTFQYWFQFIKNGFKMFTGNLLYGHDIVLNNFLNSIDNKEYDKNIDCEKGKSTIIYMNEIINKIKEK